MSDNQSAVQPGQSSNHTEELLSARLTAVNEVLNQLQTDETDETDDDIVLGGPDRAGPSMAQTIQIGENEPAAPNQTSFLETPVQSIQPVPLPGGGEGASDDSIEQYMADLLARSNGYAAPGDSDQPSVIMESPQTPSAGEAEAPQEQEPPSLEDMAEKRQHSQSEVRNNLSSMRELANMNTRSAIEAHSCKQLVRRSLLQVGMITAGLFMSFFQLRGVTSVESSSFVGAMAGTFIAILGTFLFFRTTVQLRKNSQTHQTT